ncbi:MAG: hypothetical protein IPM18_09335 [Phycisphaerales bacterium]|nr:hypothetical protein [Phycisphaerales bacterium]
MRPDLGRVEQHRRPAATPPALAFERRPEHQVQVPRRYRQGAPITALVLGRQVGAQDGVERPRGRVGGHPAAERLGVRAKPPHWAPPALTSAITARRIASGSADHAATTMARSASLTACAGVATLAPSQLPAVLPAPSPAAL